MSLIKDLYKKRNDKGLTNTLFRSLVWVHLKVRPPRPFLGHNQQFVLFDRYCKGKGDILIVGSNLPPVILKPFGDNRVVQIDLKPLDNVDVVADAENMSHVFEANKFDYVVCTSMIEHTPHPWDVISEAFKVLKPGGVLYLSAPWMYPLHGEESDFWRFSLPCLRRLVRESGFTELESGSECSPHAALYIFFKTYLSEVFSFGNMFAYYTLEYLFAWVLFPLGIVERLFRLGRRDHLYTDSIFFVVGRKPLEATLESTDT